MTNERNPRDNPQAGDVVEIGKKGSCLFRHVIGRRENGDVIFVSRCGNQWFNTTFYESLEDWRNTTKLKPDSPITDHTPPLKL